MESHTLKLRYELRRIAAKHDLKKLKSFGHPVSAFEAALRQFAEWQKEYNAEAAKEFGEQMRIHISAANYEKHKEVIEKALGIAQQAFVIHETYKKTKDYELVDRSPKAFGMKKIGVRKFKK